MFQADNVTRPIAQRNVFTLQKSNDYAICYPPVLTHIEYALSGSESFNGGVVRPKLKDVPINSICFVNQNTAYETISMGDVIVFRKGGNATVTHRVVRITADGIVTKGDANNVEDSNPVPYEKVVGHAKSKLPYAGYVVMYIKTPIGIACICGLLFVLILLTFLPNVLSKEGDKKEEKKE